MTDFLGLAWPDGRVCVLCLAEQEHTKHVPVAEHNPASGEAPEADRWAKYIALAAVAGDWFRHEVDIYPGTGKPFYVYTRPDDNRLIRLRDALVAVGEDTTHQEPGGPR